MSDIQSPQLAEMISTLVAEAENNNTLKKQLIDKPKETLKSRGIIIEGYRIVVEDNPGYPLFFALEPENIHSLSTPLVEPPEDSFRDSHFLDCQHY
ncbi:hypothetical protein B1207_01970 [Legionella quinlivanii]|uniref:Uncharacterized protein n=1 Tax=Legionella quinlivanii TaxID=45073 RepID=A0A364LNX1_9GAMM|nr:hypothetical protein [Legionella quinlivanii]RAP38670.1 hypothetical protein B1207_01970 [Legionella quinlivanii]